MASAPEPALEYSSCGHAAEQTKAGGVPAARRVEGQAGPRSVLRQRTRPALEHDKQLAVVDAGRVGSGALGGARFRVESTSDPRLSHATRLMAALVYLDSRFERLEPSFVTELIEGRGRARRPTPPPRPRLDAKAGRHRC